MYVYTCLCIHLHMGRPCGRMRRGVHVEGEHVQKPGSGSDNIHISVVNTDTYRCLKHTCLHTLMHTPTQRRCLDHCATTSHPHTHTPKHTHTHLNTPKQTQTHPNTPTHTHTHPHTHTPLFSEPQPTCADVGSTTSHTNADTDIGPGTNGAVRPIRVGIHTMKNPGSSNSGTSPCLEEIRPLTMSFLR